MASTRNTIDNLPCSLTATSVEAEGENAVSPNALKAQAEEIFITAANALQHARYGSHTRRAFLQMSATERRDFQRARIKHQEAVKDWLHRIRSL